MAAALDALEDFKGVVVAMFNLVDALELIKDAEAFADELESDASAARCRLPPAKDEEARAIETGKGGDGVGEDGCGRVGIGESAEGAVDGNEFEGDFFGRWSS
jgi:hypothetical protein